MPLPWLRSSYGDRTPARVRHCTERSRLAENLILPQAEADPRDRCRSAHQQPRLLCTERRLHPGAAAGGIFRAYQLSHQFTVSARTRPKSGPVLISRPLCSAPHVASRGRPMPRASRGRSARPGGSALHANGRGAPPLSVHGSCDPPDRSDLGIVRWAHRVRRIHARYGWRDSPPSH